MNLISMLLTGTLIAGGLGAHTLLDNQPVTEQTNAPSQTINELQAKTIALDTSKGGLVTNTQTVENYGSKTYKISIVNQDTEYTVDIDASTGDALIVNQQMKE
ncbi:PepSY domain-containing protein [Bacillus cihuensis]|uniref:PepSY domain-containing protein n=1 Tax=Bacillus cihuensis TaxID=1208599 RepID=UPI00040E3777|nr:PepSY domain-containing protein [Bacillus cihuensis]